MEPLGLWHCHGLPDLGNSGCAVSELCLGTMTFGNETDEEGARAQLDRFVETGGTFVDTADVYTHGVSEEIIGRWLADRPADVTERVVLATKGRFPFDPVPNAGGGSARHLTRALDASLSRLGTDSVDLYQVHAWDPVDPAGGDAAHAGRLRPLGEDPLLRLLELHRVAADQGGPSRASARAGGPGHAAAAVQPDRARDRVGDRPRRARRRAGTAPVEPARRRVAHRQVPARAGTDRQPPGSARTPSAAWRPGSVAAPSAPGPSSTPSSGSPRPATPRWPPSPWPGSPTGPASPRPSSARGPSSSSRTT